VQLDKGVNAKGEEKIEKDGNAIHLRSVPTIIGAVKVARWLLLIAYVGYLMQMGLLMVTLPWSKAWSPLLLGFPNPIASFLQMPAGRGLITAFGVLHFLMVVLEFLHANQRAKHGKTQVSNEELKKT
jgi:hypothetical protein